MKSEFRSLWWLIATTVIVVGCYLVTLSVADVRQRVASLDRRIAQARADIRLLEVKLEQNVDYSAGEPSDM